MAIQATNGTYITVEDVTSTQVKIRLYKDADHRARYKEGTEGDFETTIGSHEQVAVDLDAIADDTKSIEHNRLTAGYVALKTMDKYEDYTDV